MEFEEHLRGGQEMVMLFLKEFAVVRREDIRWKEVQKIRRIIAALLL